MANMHRPFGVTLLSMLQILLGVLLVFGGLTLHAIRFFLSETFPHVPWFTSSAPLAIEITLVAFALIDFILAYGLWVGRRSAWIVALTFAVLGIIITVPSFFVRSGFGEILGLIVYLLVIYQLMQPCVQIFFGRGPACTPQSVDRTASVNPSVDNPATGGFCAGCGAPKSSGGGYFSSCGAKLG